MMSPENLSATAGRGGNVGNVQAPGVGESAAAQPRTSPRSALLALPGDLGAWLRCTPTREAARILGVSEGRVRQLRTGNGRAVSPEILRRWQTHRAKGELPALPWQVRKVMAGGAVWFGGRCYASRALSVYEGRQVNVALLDGGKLLVQPIALGGGMVAQEAVEGEP